jgi:hypothetical protein
LTGHESPYSLERYKVEVGGIEIIRGLVIW